MTAYHHGKSGMARRAFLAAGGAAVLLSAAARAAPYAASRTPLDGFIDAQRVSAGIPGMAVGYARDGVVRFARGYGFADIALKRPVTADTMFHIASVTKTVTATMILRLAEQGRLKLDETVAPYLDFPLVHPHRPDAAITFRHLLMHASGISDARYYAIDFRTPGKAAALPLGSFLKDYLAPGGRYYAADGCFSRAVSGAAWDYSNVGFALLGYVAGRIGGDMREQSRRQIFAPLGMAHTDWSLGDVPQALRETPYDGVDGVLTPIAPDGFPDWPAGLMRSSVADFARFVAASANGGTAEGTRVLGGAAMAQMLEMKKLAGLPDWLTGQGLGWAASNLAGAVRPNHWGGDRGIFTAVYLDPQERSGVAIFTNMTATAASKTAVKAVAARLLGRDGAG